MNTVRYANYPALPQPFTENEITEITDCLFSFFFKRKKIERSFIKVLTEQEIVIL